MASIKSIARKELDVFFSSFTAIIFLGSFLLVTLFVFFWVDTFFSRNIADLRPLFERMPVLMIFLCSALSMRMWSEERRAGTIEFLLSSPASNIQLVLGKFLACMILVLIALLLSLPLPLMVAFLGPLDWGPVFGGYIATLLLSSAYTAIGLYISSRTENQIVSILLSILFCGILALIGSDAVAGLFNNNVAEALQLLGTSSRFQAITCGVIDLRDFYYYISLALIFLSLNVLGLEQIRWAGNRSNSRHKDCLLICALLTGNLIAGNFWLSQIDGLRIDLTEGHVYSISDVTRKYLASLKERLAIRAYFSRKNHPALAALVPRLRDLLKEYAIASHGKVQLEFIDPMEKPELASEAETEYGVKPATFQTLSKYQRALTSSYFDVVLKYGDQFQKLSSKDLIDVKMNSLKDFEVQLRNPEYDITKAIRKVLNSYQASGNPFASIDQEIELKAYISPDSALPESFQKLRKVLLDTLKTWKEKSHGKFNYTVEDPDAGSADLAKKLETEFGMKPLERPSLGKTFWFYITLYAKSSPDKIVAIGPPPGGRSAMLERHLLSALERFNRGFLRTIGISEPPAPLGRVISGSNYTKDFSVLKQKLAQSFNVLGLNLNVAKVPESVDLLILLAPDRLSKRELFAVDQFLMKGGTVIISTGAFDCALSGSFNCKPLDSGLSDWLQHNGVEIKKTMVLDPQDFPFILPPSPGGVNQVENSVVAYPYFVDIRTDGMNKDELITSRLNQVTLNWASPIAINTHANKNLKFTQLLRSSEKSWTSDSKDLLPKLSKATPLGFPEGTKTGRELLSLAVEGRFESFFKGKESPLKELTAEQKQSGQDKSSPDEPVLERSAANARIVLFGSNTFLSDRVLMLESGALQNQYLNSIELLENAVDWSLEDRDLLSIRGHGFFARTLRMKDPNVAMIFEYSNYALALLGLGLICLIRNGMEKQAKLEYQKITQEALNLAKEEGRT